MKKDFALKYSLKYERFLRSKRECFWGWHVILRNKGDYEPDSAEHVSLPMGLKSCSILINESRFRRANSLHWVILGVAKKMF